MPITSEVIIIDDGSTDNTLEKIKLVSAKYPTKRIKILTQENLGVSAARNTGINYSTGEYVTFLDSDDYYAPYFWDIFPDTLESEDYDIFEFNALQFEKYQEETLNIVRFDAATHFIKISQRIPAFRNSQWFPWARVYKTNLLRLNNIIFPDNCHYEDMHTIPQIYLVAKSVFPIKKNLIHYRKNDSSI